MSIDTSNLLVKTTLMTTEEVQKDKWRIRQIILNEDRRHKKALKEIDRQLRMNQIRCPHEKTHIESGQYMPCVEVCDICEMEIS